MRCDVGLIQLDRQGFQKLPSMPKTDRKPPRQQSARQPARHRRQNRDFDRSLVSVFIYIYTYTNIHTYIHTYTHTCVYIHMCVWSTIGRRKTGRNLKATKPETLKLTSTTQGISSISTGCYHGCPDPNPLHKSHVNLGFGVPRSVFFVVCVCVFRSSRPQQRVA